MTANIKIIFEDKNIIIVEKPQGIPTQSDKTNDESLFQTINNNTNNEIFLIHRLDRPVGGIMIFAKNRKSCDFLSKQIQNKTLKKTYLAVVCGISKEESTLIDYIIKNERLNISKIVNKNNRGAKKAELSYKLIQTVNTPEYGFLSLLKIGLKTGRHHQIRVQLSNSGFPIWGDTKYNPDFGIKGKHKINFVKIALFSNSIQFINPTTNKAEQYTITPPNTFPFNLFAKDL